MPSMATLSRVTPNSPFERRGGGKLKQHRYRTVTRAPCICFHVCFICFAVSENTILTLASESQTVNGGMMVPGQAVFQRPQGTTGSTNKESKVAIAEINDEEISAQAGDGWGQEAPTGRGFSEVLSNFSKSKRAPESDIQGGMRQPFRRRAQRESGNSFAPQPFWPPTTQPIFPPAVHPQFTQKKAGMPGPAPRDALQLGRVNAVHYPPPWSPAPVAQRKEGLPARRMPPLRSPGPHFLPSPGTWVYTEEQRRPDVTEELRRLPPAEGRKTLMATALLYLVGWMSLPWALGAAGVGLYKALRSNHRREAALMRALARARNPKADGLTGL